MDKGLKAFTVTLLHFNFVLIKLIECKNKMFVLNINSQVSRRNTARRPSTSLVTEGPTKVKACKKDGCKKQHHRH